MGNGSHGEGPARADRLRDKYDKYNRATQRAIDAIPAPGSQPYREEMDSNSEVTVDLKNLQGKAKGIPSRALGVAIIILAIAAAVVAVLRFWPG